MNNKIKNARCDILLVTNDAATIRLLTNYFESKGYTCKDVSNGAQALTELNAHSPQLILLDEITDYSSEEFFIKIKSDETLKDIPIYLLSRSEVKKTDHNFKQRNKYFNEDVVNFFKF